MKWRHLMILPLALSFAGCETASNLIMEPAATDPLDGYDGILPQAGIQTEFDYGPKQNTLLGLHKTLLEAHEQLKQDYEQKVAENQNLQAQLNAERDSLDKERSMRAQSDAETERLQRRSRDLEAKILSLSIQKAKLEQDRLRGQIAALNETLQKMEPAAAEASATPGRRP